MTDDQYPPLELVRVRPVPDLPLLYLEVRVDDDQAVGVPIDPDQALLLARTLIDAVMRLPHYEHWPWVRHTHGWSRGPGQAGETLLED